MHSEIVVADWISEMVERVVELHARRWKGKLPPLEGIEETELEICQCKLVKEFVPILKMARDADILTSLVYLPPPPQPSAADFSALFLHLDGGIEGCEEEIIIQGVWKGKAGYSKDSIAGKESDKRLAARTDLED